MDLKVIKSRIADLSPKIESMIKNINFFEISKPVFLGNNGYVYVKCDKKEAKLNKIMTTCQDDEVPVSDLAVENTRALERFAVNPAVLFNLKFRLNLSNISCKIVVIQFKVIFC